MDTWQAFAAGVLLAVACAGAYTAGRQQAIRMCRRIARHGYDLDLVYYEDAERDPTVHTASSGGRAAGASRAVIPWREREERS